MMMGDRVKKALQAKVQALLLAVPQNVGRESNGSVHAFKFVCAVHSGLFLRAHTSIGS